MTDKNISTDIERRIEKFLYSEALLLDEERLDEWLDLLAEDLFYMSPITETLDHRSEEDVLADGRFRIFEEGKPVLAKRVQRLKTNFAHAEQPRSRVRRLITNILVTDAQDGTYEVRSNFLVFQSRLESTEAFFVGNRRDTLVEHADGFLIKRREIVFAHRLLPRSLSILF